MNWRTLALLLMLLNALYWTWGEGWLLPYGFGPAQQREPQRLAQQIKPEAITVLRAAEGQLPPLPAAPQAVLAEPSVCLQSGPLNQAQADAVRALLAGSWPSDGWLLQQLQQESQVAQEQASDALDASQAGPNWRLRLSAVDQALQAKLLALGAVLPGQAFEVCPPDSPDPQAR